jgi:hypothetical protein
MNLHKLMPLILASVIILAAGCVSGKDYRFNIPVEEVPCSPAVVGSCATPASSMAVSSIAGVSESWPSTADQLPPGPPCNVKNAADFRHPCLAYIEFDDLGELRDRQSNSPPLEFQPGSSVQVNRAIETIRASMRDGKADPQSSQLAGILSQPVVFVFVHGWKHNASSGPPEDTNVQGVKEFLDMLKEHYPDVWVTPDLEKECDQRTDECTVRLLHPVVGVYVAWRGNSISEAFPVTQQFTYFDREKTAYRVGNTSLTYALTQISAVAHPQGSSSNVLQPFLVIVGHSFGGLVLERALAQSLMTRINDVDAEDREASFADLIIYVNTAEAATDSKQVLDLMAENRITNSALTRDENGNLIPNPEGKRYPQIISLSSTADQATSTALPIGHALPLLEMKMAGSVRNPDPMACYEPELDLSNKSNTTARREISDFSQGDFYLHSAPHFQPLQSHEVLQLSAQDGTNACINKENYIQAGKSVFQGPHPPKGFDKLTFSDETARDSFGPTPIMGGKCYLIVPKDIEVPNRPRCNGTAYFVMEVPPEIIPDHNTIFTQRLFQFLSVFLSPVEASKANPSAPQKGILTHRVLEGVQQSKQAPQ